MRGARMATKFDPSPPSGMPEALINAAKQVYQQRDKETKGTWSRRMFKHLPGDEKFNDEHIFLEELLPIPSEEEVLYKICQSEDVASSAAKLEKAVSVPPKLWEGLIHVGISFREQVRTVDKRTKKERIEVLENISKQLELTTKLVSEEIFGRYSDGLLSGELDHPLEPFGHMLLSDIQTFPFSVAGEKEQGRPRKKETIRFRGRLSPGSVARANTALSKRIKMLISKIKRSDNISERRFTDRRRRKAKPLREARRQGYFEMRQLFYRYFPDNSKQSFEIARHQVICAFITSVLGDAGTDDLYIQYKGIADDYREWRKLQKKF